MRKGCIRCISPLIECEWQVYSYAKYGQAASEYLGYVGGVVNVLNQPEMFGSFNVNLPTGKRTWWDKVSPEFIYGVSGTGGPFYNRPISYGLSHIRGLVKIL
jgi:hypothetical protein